MAWVYLAFAIVLEVAGTTCMKFSDGFTNTLPSVLLFVFYGLSFVALTMALRDLELTIVYAIWAGLGTALIAVLGFVWFHEPVNAMKIVAIAVIVGGVVTLNLSGA